MIAYDDARDFVLSLVTPLAPLSYELVDALGCVAAERVLAREAVPGFANSSMDGFALRSVDSEAAPVRLRVVGTTLAGSAPAAVLAPGEAQRIMTGAPMPPGADCVCMIEEVTVDDDGLFVEISRIVAAGENVRLPGEDVMFGDELLRVGEVLRPPRLGVLASQGLSSVLVHPRPRVGVVSTGNELTDAASALGPGQIRDTNRPLLKAMLRESGFEAVDLGVAIDDEAATKTLLAAGASSCDAVISTGGVSVGDVDHVKSAILQLAGERARWMQVAIKPGKPFAFGVSAEGTPLFGLPGNPVSTRVSFELFVRPALRRLAGHDELDRVHFRAVLDAAIPRKDDGKLHVLHAQVALGVDQRLHVVRVVREGSHLLRGIADANALVLLPERAPLEEGCEVDVVVLDVEQLRAHAT